MLSSLWLLAGGLAFLYVLARLRRRGRMPLPPGPRPLPLIGNALDIPTIDVEKAYRDMNAQYGDVVYLDALGQPMIFLGSHETALELLEKRSSIYSDRKASVMAELTGWEWVLTVQPYSAWWRRHRKAFHQHFNAHAVAPYQPSQQREAHRLAYRLLADPKNFLRHVRLGFASSILRIAYGIELGGMEDEYVSIAEAAMAVFNKAFVPGKYTVESLPFLRFLPSWFPGATFKREAREWKPRVHRLRDTPWVDTLAKIRDGSAPPSMMSSLLSDLAGTDTETEAEIVKNSVGVAYAGGADTTLSAIMTFFLAMASFPEVQAKAQAELDAVVGQRRLPEFSDKESLPYLRASIKECLRWRVVVPLGFPHRSIEDDEFRGYHIPKGSMIVTNLWAYLHDPERFPDPERFEPERFLKDGQLNPDVLDPADVAFGYGRRICPGRHFADASLFILTATVLHTLSISAPLDANGKPIKLKGKMTPGVISYPEPYEVDVKARGAWAEALIRESCKSDKVPL
ncbi:cytochrome P450 [Trametes polyzona]|nr:cytochrome P450 [Trametes polyzona]